MVQVAHEGSPRSRCGVTWAFDPRASILVKRIATLSPGILQACHLRIVPTDGSRFSAAQRSFWVCRIINCLSSGARVLRDTKTLNGSTTCSTKLRYMYSVSPRAFGPRPSNAKTIDCRTYTGSVRAAIGNNDLGTRTGKSSAKCACGAPTTLTCGTPAHRCNWSRRARRRRSAQRKGRHPSCDR